RFSAREDQRWYTGDSVSVTIGQGYSLATPLQLAYATSILANNGVAYRPHLVKYIVDTETGEQVAVEPQPARHVKLHPQWVTLVRNAMVDVTKPGGTASRAGKDAAYPFAGKTGTAQVIG